MKSSHPYEALIKKLQDNHFYPALQTKVKNKTKVIEGLQVDSPSILKDSREKRLKEIVGDEYEVKWQGNGEINQHFLIKLK